MKTRGIQQSLEFLQELRAMALAGAETKTLVAHIRETFGLQTQAIVPILGYLARAFRVLCGYCCRCVRTASMGTMLAPSKWPLAIS